MSETPPEEAKAPTPEPIATQTPPPPPPPPGPAQQAATGGDATYTAAELQAAAASLGAYPWDVPSVFALRGGVTEMSEADFKTALEELRTPPAEPAADENE